MEKLYKGNHFLFVFSTFVDACQVIALTWPSAPKPVGGGGLVSMFIAKGLDQPYAMASNTMQVHSQYLTLIGSVHANWFEKYLFHSIVRLSRHRQTLLLKPCSMCAAY